MLFFFVEGFWVIVIDCWGYGCFDQVSEGYDMDYYVVDVLVVVEYLDLYNVVYVGYFIGGGQVVCYVVCYGQLQGWVVKVVLISVVLLLMVKIEQNLGGMLIEVFDGFCKVLVVNCVQFYFDVVFGLFYGFNCDGVEIFQGMIQNWW